jgi:predicted MFS family arabinose efflux permease
MISSFVGLLVGTPIGGLLARQWGLTAPFWFGFVGSALLVVLLWRELEHIAHAGEVGP